MAKLLFLRDLGPTEVGAFGVAPSDDPLLVEDVAMVRQRCGPAWVGFDDDAVAAYFEERVGRGLEPRQFARVWLHTHPGDSPHPSGVDEETFARVFGPCDWAVMAILAQGGRWSARLRVQSGPRVEVEVPVRVAWDAPFPASDPTGWRSEYSRCVQSEVLWPEPGWPDSVGPDPVWPDPVWPERGRRLFLQRLGVAAAEADALWSAPPD